MWTHSELPVSSPPADLTPSSTSHNRVFGSVCKSRRGRALTPRDSLPLLLWQGFAPWLQSLYASPSSMCSRTLTSRLGTQFYHLAVLLREHSSWNRGMIWVTRGSSSTKEGPPQASSHPSSRVHTAGVQVALRSLDILLFLGTGPAVVQDAFILIHVGPESK